MWFFACDDTSSDNAARTIIDWAPAFSVPKSLMSDGATHFKNEAIRLVSKDLKVPYHFAVPNCPRFNRTVERLGRQYLRVFPYLVSEFQMRPGEWPDILPLVQRALNNAPSPQKKRICPITAFTRLDPTPPISTFIHTTTASQITITDLQMERSVNIDKLKKLVAKLHPAIQLTLDQNWS